MEEALELSFDTLLMMMMMMMMREEVTEAHIKLKSDESDVGNGGACNMKQRGR